MNTAPLTDRDREMLAFAGTYWRYRGRQDEAIRVTFGVTPTRYWQQVRAIITRPEALAHDPILVRRLQRIMGQRRAG